MLKVNADRWKVAQAWEEKAWVVAVGRTGWRKMVWPVVGPFVRMMGLRNVEGNDWNDWWARQFENYSFLPNTMENFIELGCGPFTNARIILENRKAEHIVCSDPLAKTYVKFRDRWLAKQHAQGKVLVDDHPIEECPYASNYFDCVVMINVLDHVRDADLCMEQCMRIVKPGGYLIIGQDLTTAEDAAAEPEGPERDIGHPILLMREDLDKHLGGFKTVLRKDLSREAGRKPELHYSTLIYAGQKVGASA